MAWMVVNWVWNDRRHPKLSVDTKIIDIRWIITKILAHIWYCINPIFKERMCYCWKHDIFAFFYKNLSKIRMRGKTASVFIRRVLSSDKMSKYCQDMEQICSKLRKIYFFSLAFWSKRDRQDNVWWSITNVLGIIDSIFLGFWVRGTWKRIAHRNLVHWN